MKLPRDITGRGLAKALSRLGYEIDHQTGSHMRLTTGSSGVHHVTIPDHSPLKIGTLAGILRDIAAHHSFSRAELLEVLFS